MWITLVHIYIRQLCVVYFNNSKIPEKLIFAQETRLNRTDGYLSGSFKFRQFLNSFTSWSMLILQERLHIGSAMTNTSHNIVLTLDIPRKKLILKTILNVVLCFVNQNHWSHPRNCSFCCWLPLTVTEKNVFKLFEIFIVLPDHLIYIVLWTASCFFFFVTLYTTYWKMRLRSFSAHDLTFCC